MAAAFQRQPAKSTQLYQFESRWRSIAKAISWRIIAFLVTGSLVWISTGELALAASLGSLDALIKLFIYFFHERAWNRISFGRSLARRIHPLQKGVST